MWNISTPPSPGSTDVCLRRTLAPLGAEVDSLATTLAWLPPRLRRDTPTAAPAQPGDADREDVRLRTAEDKPEDKLVLSASAPEIGREVKIELPPLWYMILSSADRSDISSGIEIGSLSRGCTEADVGRDLGRCRGCCDVGSASGSPAGDACRFCSCRGSTGGCWATWPPGASPGEPLGLAEAALGGAGAGRVPAAPVGTPLDCTGAATAAAFGAGDGRPRERGDGEPGAVWRQS